MKEPTVIWSLGKYRPIGSKDNNRHAAISGTRSIILQKNDLYGYHYYVESYVKGQHCDETNSGRETEVRLVYCGEDVVLIIFI